MRARMRFGATALFAAALTGCSIDAPSPLGGGDARVNGVHVGAAPLAESLVDRDLRQITVDIDGCRPVNLTVTGALNAEALVGALIDMGVVAMGPNGVTVTGAQPNLRNYNAELRCERGPRVDRGGGRFSEEVEFNATGGVAARAPEGPFRDSFVDAAPRFGRASDIDDGAPIDAGRVRPGDGLFRAQLGIYPTYPAAADAWRALIGKDRRFRGEPVVVQPANGSYRLLVLRRTRLAADAFCDGMGRQAASCFAGEY